MRGELGCGAWVWRQYATLMGKDKRMLRQPENDFPIFRLPL